MGDWREAAILAWACGMLIACGSLRAQDAPALVDLTCSVTRGTRLYSSRIEALLAKEGLAEIYKVNRGEGYYLIAFGFGDKHGLTLGQEFTFLDPEGHQVGDGKVQEVTPTDAIGNTWVEQMIRPGYLVSLKR